MDAFWCAPLMMFIFFMVDTTIRYKKFLREEKIRENMMLGNKLKNRLYSVCYNLGLYKRDKL